MAIICVSLLLCFGCSPIANKPTVYPESGLYSMIPVDLDNGCGVWYDIEDFESLETLNIEIDVRLDMEELDFIIFNTEYPETYTLDLEDNTAMHSTILRQEWYDNQTYVITQTQEWYFEWSTPTSSYGYVGIYVKCNGDCPEDAPDFGAETVPCNSNLYSSLEKVEES